MNLLASTKAVVAWPQHRGATLGAAAALLVMLVITGVNVFSGAPEARAPAESLFQYPDRAQWQQARSAEGVSGSFAERPLFTPNRRATAAVEVPAAPVAPVVAVTRTLDGWALLGIFDSGEMKGAIVRHRDGSRYRPVLGDRVDNWRLISVTARSAQLESVIDGSVAELDMGLARVRELPLAAAPEHSAAQSSESGGEGEQPSEGPPEEAKPKLMTFEGYYGGPRSKDK